MLPTANAGPAGDPSGTKVPFETSRRAWRAGVFSI